ncbi:MULTISPECIES: hypothetical protein [unclassified Clostridioides]|uniref:hypothetical protein n=1 Tax=unclassified Clostridioides TaxID=2635829 RepID=UPI001D1071D2|nr:hypothetical protein [Clostridioides sp. ES-S-0171-01]MCC0688426.1 hypothetical protein [Clostridioides sp. ES-S-0056-01]MCC0715935.1 hypothetical protein [Clostridioides sp. ES-S-0077-01]UDN54680.1 hypothetical protein JJC02_17790 [Clostridioides sp. ES-S-0054-01]
MLKRNFENVEDNKILYSINQRMILAIPAIMAGSTTLVILNLSNHLDFDIIVEYVKNLNQRYKLYGLGGKIYQEYYYSKTIPC